MARRVLPLLLFALLAAPADATLIGGPDGEPLRLLDADAQPLEGSPELPAGTIATAAAPTGSRFAALGRRWVVVADRHGVITRLRSHGARAVYWPGRKRIVTVDDRRAPLSVRTHHLGTGRNHLRTFEGGVYGDDAAGRRLRIVLRQAPRYRLVVANFDGGRFRGTTRLPVPEGVPPLSVDAALSGDLALLSYPADSSFPVTDDRTLHELVRLSDGRRRRVSAGGLWLTPRIVAHWGRLALVDRERMRMTRVVETDDRERPVAYRGGAVLGFARAVYDAQLDQVGDHPELAFHDYVSTPSVFVEGDRVYGRTKAACAPGEEDELAIVDIPGGTVVERRSGAYAIGTIGRRVDRPNDDDCD